MSEPPRGFAGPGAYGTCPVCGEIFKQPEPGAFPVDVQVSSTVGVVAARPGPGYREALRRYEADLESHLETHSKLEVLEKLVKSQAEASRLGRIVAEIRRLVYPEVG